MANKKKAQDSSPYVFSGKKIAFDFEMREFPWTEKQKLIIEVSQRKETKIIFIKACAGTGKTLLATYAGLKRLKDKKAANLVYVRVPVESCSHGIGFVPGDKDEKMDSFLAPAMDHLQELIVNGGLSRLLAEDPATKARHIEAVPLGYLKGRTFNGSTLVLDEAEDATAKELKLAMNRFGKFSLMFIIGDDKQSDVKKNGFLEVYNAFNNAKAQEKGIFCFEFTSDDCMRSEITKFIIDTFDTIGV